jgi:N-acetylglutamate synthase-like GNAT family acetyltransferase
VFWAKKRRKRAKTQVGFNTLNKKFVFRRAQEERKRNKKHLINSFVSVVLFLVSSREKRERERWRVKSERERERKRERCFVPPSSSLSSSLSSSSSSFKVNVFSLGKNHEARTNPTRIHERILREEKKISSSSSWKKRRRRRKKRNTNAKNNNAIVDDDVNRGIARRGDWSERRAIVRANKENGRFGNDLVKKNVEEDKEDNEEGKSRDFLHESLGITYRLVEKGKQQDLECDLDALNDIFVSVNFSRRPNDKLYLALEKSYLCCFAEVDVEYETRALDVNNNSVESTSVETRREVIGFARMTSDAAFVGTVWDLVVAPPYQGKGIGTAIVERMIAKAKETAPGMVVNLCAVAEAENMYKRIGFRKNEEEVIAMQFNPALQAMNRFQSVNFSIQ